MVAIDFVGLKDGASCSLGMERQKRVSTRAARSRNMNRLDKRAHNRLDQCGFDCWVVCKLVKLI